MLAKKRRFEPAVIERLFREPYRFEYFQAVRMLELWLARHGAAAAGPGGRFPALPEPDLAGLFPASQLESIQAEPRELARDAPRSAPRWQSATLRQWPPDARLHGPAGRQRRAAGALHGTHRRAQQQPTRTRAARFPRHVFEPLAGAVLRSLAQVPAAR
jgi:hypothetical protein